jgi:hypothetical protein
MHFGFLKKSVMYRVKYITGPKIWKTAMSPTRGIKGYAPMPSILFAYQSILLVTLVRFHLYPTYIGLKGILFVVAVEIVYQPT